VLVCPRYDLKDKTKQLFSYLTSADHSDGLVTRRLIAALVAGSFPDSALLYNAFERVAYTTFENLLAHRARIMRTSGRDVHLTGSGPTLFTLYPAAQENHARKLHAALESAGMRAYLARLITNVDEGRKTKDEG
jgi:4-diphosphocytidyl-2-C-methyl-D-erythritol kinase